MAAEKRRPLINVLCEIRRFVTREYGVAGLAADFIAAGDDVSLHRC
jgi:hypothetical protein